MRKSFLVVMVLICCQNALAQQLRVSIAVVKEDNLPRIELSNSHNVPIESVVITSEHVGRNQFPDTIVYDVHLNYKYDLPIKPGSSQQIRLPLMDAQDFPTPTLRAVIFSDGTTQGEEFWIRHLPNKRKLLLENLEQVIALLRDMITQELSREQALAALQAAWDERIRGYKRVTAEEHEASERIFGSAGTLLQDGSSRDLMSDADFSALLLRVVRGFEGWRAGIRSAALVSSKPPRTLGSRQIDSQKVE